MSHLAQFDPEVAGVIESERLRQLNGLELIASENIVSRNVLEAMGSIMTNKYAEGYPGKRYYGGCEYHDVVENLARDRMCELFGAEHANVQPHSGSQANQAVYFAYLNYKDRIMSQSLTQGGHLSHGSPVNISGKWYSIFQYGVDPESETLDYAALEEMARIVKPSMIVCGASAYPREIDFKAFQEIAEGVGASCMADIAHIAGLCATGHHNNPVGVVDYVTTTTHKTLRGPRGGAIMCSKEDAPAIDKSVFPGMQGGPLMHVIAAKAVCFREAMHPSFKDYCGQVIKNAKTMAEVLSAEGLDIVSGGTDNHLILLDLTGISTNGEHLTGLAAENALGEAGITVNKNTIPREQLSPFVTSGLRIGTPAVTSRGMKEEEMKQIGDWIARVLKDVARDKNSKKAIDEVREEVVAMASRYPLYPEIA
ncbi:serine hydroxymethyltransferase [Methanoculleus sp. FWC-SCC1]|uniref:Serine hydroxymethyltransferase n=1 Tax=Methanoculleus frigidifontis TaxID=2584085 RepID=A0ABT8MCI3_9EURY|nr:serine hydroxymethyltransferase [Methanoculleus sp. FWC-SCC1]MDN7025644.1 serine hydroxymethyltransferase [Methanoculleus sp. FWC-SCC1]